MNARSSFSAPSADQIFRSWLGRFGSALERRDVDALVDGFDADSYWKDFLSFTWEHRTFSGPEQIREAFAATLEKFQPRKVRMAEGRAAPRMLRRSSKDVIEAYLDFDTTIGRATGFVRLLHNWEDPTQPRIWLLLTALQDLRGFEEKVGPRRPTGDEYAKITRPGNWWEDRQRQRAFADRDPSVLIVGAGHAGLMLAARLGQMDVDTLVVEKTPRVGDVWRDRYHSLTLHNECTANHMPYLPFPETWPVWLSKDRLGGWLEHYVEALDLNVWTSTELVRAEYDESAKLWTAVISRAGEQRTIRCPHLVVATGVSGSIPHVPEAPGLQDFKGEVKHSAHYTRGKDYAGKRAMVVGTGNSGHDIAQDLFVHSAGKVWMYQRGPTCVVSLQPSAAMVYKVYSEGPSVDDIDMMTSAIPYPVIEDTYRFISRRSREFDGELLERLNKAGFKTYYGRDDTGFHMMYLRGEGGYYINVGCSDLIANGDVGVIQAADADRFVADGLRMKDGTVVPLDLVVLATGFQNMQENIRRMLGDEIADKLGPVWGFDEDHQMRNMWRRTPQDGFWLMGGALIDARFNSRFLAIQIKAALEGMLPERSAMPLVARHANAACAIEE